MQAIGSPIKMQLLGAFRRDMDVKNHSMRIRANENGTFSIRPTHRTNTTQMVKTEQLVSFDQANNADFRCKFDIPAGYYRLTGGVGHRGWYVLEPVAITLADLLVTAVVVEDTTVVEELVIDPNTVLPKAA